MEDRRKPFLNQGETRRDFMKKTAAVFASGNMLTGSAYGSSASLRVAIVVDAEDPMLKQPPVGWALEQFQHALSARGLSPEMHAGRADPSPADERILVARRTSALARAALDRAAVRTSDSPESLALVRKAGSGNELLVCGSDVRGLVYGLLELADRVTLAADPAGALQSVSTTVQEPANAIRSITRSFTSEPEDKPWFYDKSFWQRYLTMLARERFNRFSLALGLGHNSPRNVPDSYFYFSYPFLLSVPGYQVGARGLPDEERDRNLVMLRWISQEVKNRGLHFQLALWTHAYQFENSPKVNYDIMGLSPQNHAAYCRDALQKLLQEVPAIDGVTFRAHSESGIPEGSYDFWRTLFDGVARSGRRVEIDIHSKGIEHKLIEMALATGMPVNVSPKYWAEHMGLPYHQASIRELERARPRGPNAPVEAERRFTRYGYGDYLREDRRYGILWRMWPGTQRVLLWGDPVMASGYSRHSTFCGSLGLELCEPLSFKGRMGSGSPGGREPYADPSLQPPGGDWEKYLYGYRLWGRLLYDPNSAAETWARFLKADFGTAAKECEQALARASRVLPLVTTAHDPSASNNRYWPEMYTDMPIVGEAGHPYSDTPSPKRFAWASSLDPVLFSSVDEFTAELIKGRRSGKYSPLDVARWLEELASSAERHLDRAQTQMATGSSSFRRLAVDVRVQAGIGRYFAEKFRAAVAYTVYERTGHRTALDEALKHYRAARDAWKRIARETTDVYRKDLTFGREPYLRGHWSDRLPAIEADLADMEKKSRNATSGSDGDAATSAEQAVRALMADLSARPEARPPRCNHVPTGSFRRAAPLTIDLTFQSGPRLSGLRLHYRRVNQAEDYRIAELSAEGKRYRHVIPGEYTDSPYPLMYYFELRRADGRAWLYPGLEPNLSNQPYFVVRAAK